MSAHGPDPSDLLPMVGDIVERNVDNDSAGHNSMNTAATPALRPIAAVVGRAFPVVRTRRAYGRPGTATAEETGSQSTRVPASPASIPVSRFTGLSAHVQPQDGETDRENVDDARAQLAAVRMQVPENGREAVLPAGGSAQQRLQAHQWSAAEFAQLRRGYYVAPVSAPPSPSGTSDSGVTDTSVNAASPVTASAALSTHDAAGGGAPPTGEDFFRLLFQCLRSTVRKHQQLALEVLLDHLRGLVAQNATLPRLCEEAAALRERCLHGPNCGPFLFFVLEILVSAGHPAMVELAATSLLLLLRDLPSGDAASGGAGGMVEAGGTRCAQLSLFTDAVSEIGNPAGDAPSRQNGVDADSGNDEASSGDEDTADGESTRKKRKSALRSDDASAEEKQKEEKDDAELPFSAVSELLRGPDARYGLEEMGFTNKVLVTMQLLVLHSGENDDNDDSTKSSVHLSDRVRGDESQRLAADSVTASGITSSSQAHLSSRHAQVLFLELLLCGGVGIGQRAACRRVAQDPQFLSWMEGQLSAVVLGQRPLDSVMELLCVLQHLAHVPAALRSLLRGGPKKGQIVSTAAEGKAMGCEDSAKSANRAVSEEVNSAGGVAGVPATTTTSVLADAQRQQQRFHETWLLFFLYVCSTAETDVRTVRQVFTLVWSMLFLRACTRQGGHRDSIGHGLVHDLSDTLLTEGMSVGAAIVLEMEFLQYANAGSKGMRTSQPGSLDTYFFNVAQSALQLFRRPTEVMVKKEAGSEAAQQASTSTTSTAAAAAAADAKTLLRTFQWISCGHFLSTYLTTMRRHAPAVCFTLCGSAVETQEAVRDVVRHVVLSPAKIQGAFARFTSPLLSFTAVKETATEGEVSEGWRGAVVAVLHRWTPHTTTATALTVEKEKGAVATSSVPTAGSTTNSQQQQQQQQSCAGTVTDAKMASSDVNSTDNARDAAVLRLSFEAAALYANTRAAVALADVYPAVARDLVVGYAGMLSQSYQDSCLRLRDGAAQRLQVDELCTMAEAVQLLKRYSSDNLTNETAASHADVASGGVAGQPRLEESNESRGKVEAAEHGTSYNREARLGAFFLLHSIAISKHCLDVVPLLLPLVQLQPFSSTSPEKNSPAAITDSAMAQVALMASLQAGIECTPVPWMMMSSGGSDAQSASVALTGAPRSWVVYPLYDASLPSKAAWARWLRGLLGLHRRVKDVVGWDAVLCHTLLWMLTHRRALWASPACASESTSAVPVEEENEEETESEEVRGDPQSAAALCGLVVDLCAVLHDHDGGLSVAACRTLEVSLTAYSDVPSEAGLPLLLHAVVAYVAGHSSARVALAALQLLLATPVLPTAQRGVQSNSEVACDVSSPPQSSGPAKASQTFSMRTSSENSSVSATAAATAQLCDWLQRWSVAQRQRVQSASSAHWSLEDVVALLQLIGPSLNTGWSSGSQGKDDDTTSNLVWNGEGSDVLKEGQNCSSVQDKDALWCVRCLADGLLGYYVQQRRATSGALSAMEKAVLQSTLEELDWYPAVLWPHVAA